MTTLPPLGPAPTPADSAPAYGLMPMSLYSLGFRSYSADGVEYILPPLCPVPGGIFVMGSDPTHDKQASHRDTPQHPVQVNDFAIGMYPVTVTEYACFVRAEDKAPSEMQGPTTWDQQLPRFDHPVVMVSWREAGAYAKWLADQSGHAWRLPTEAEWEKAARGDAQITHNRLYPWGAEFDPARCNTSESSIGGTTPIGSYPTGASPYGAQDMAGNVLEWTSSLYKLYPYDVADGREDPDSPDDRVLRGGSWLDGADLARAVSRCYKPLGKYGDLVGFRLVFGVPASM